MEATWLGTKCTVFRCVRIVAKAPTNLIMSVCRSVYLIVRPSVLLSVHLSYRLSAYINASSCLSSVCLSIHPTVCLSVRVSFRLSANISVATTGRISLKFNTGAAMEISYVYKVRVLLKLGKNIGHFPWRPNDIITPGNVRSSYKLPLWL